MVDEDSIVPTNRNRDLNLKNHMTLALLTLSTTSTLAVTLLKSSLLARLAA